MRTEVVYVCTPDRRQQLRTSLTTLVRSGTTLDAITVYLVGGNQADWSFSDPAIEVVAVPPVFPGYVFGNKVLLCDSDADRVVFLDTDTFVLNSIDRVWEMSEADVMARVATAYEDPRWDRVTWNATFAKHAAAPVPMFNAGMLLFSNGAHRRIKEAWRESICRYLRRELELPWADNRMPDQFGLSLGIALSKLSTFELGPREHVFGWARERHDQDSVVLHTGAGRFKETLRQLEDDPEACRRLTPEVELHRSFRDRLSSGVRMVKGAAGVVKRRLLSIRRHGSILG